jgi:hypothetical protein
VIVAMVSVPIVGALAYILIFGAIQQPDWFLLFFGLYAAGLILRFLLTRLKPPTAAKVEAALNTLAFVGLLGWVGWSLIQVWLKDGPRGLLLNVVLMVVGLVIVHLAAKRAEAIDYSRR